MSGFWTDQDLSPNRIDQARRRAEHLDGYLDLTSSNPTQQGLLFPEVVLRAAAEGYWATRRYDPDPRGSITARQAIVDYYARRNPPLRLSADHLFLTASTSEAYSLLFALLTAPGDNVLAPEVTYPLFEYLAAMHHIELRPYRMVETENWDYDPGSLAEHVDERTRAVLLISPHNPTGKVISASLAILDQLGLPLISDEVFEPFTYGVPSVPPLAALHPDVSVFHLNGISKMFALPDLKLGWIALNSPAGERFGARLELLNDTFLGANSLVQHMLPRLFEDGASFVATMVQRVRDNLDYALERFAESGHVRVNPPDGGYYLFPRVLGEKNEEALVLRLLDAGLSLHPGFFYGYESGVHLMLSALTMPAPFRAGVDRLLSVLES